MLDALMSYAWGEIFEWLGGGIFAAATGVLSWRKRSWKILAVGIVLLGLVGVWLWDRQGQWNAGHAAGRAELRAEIDAVTQSLNEALSKRDEASQALAAWRNRWLEDTNELERDLARARALADDGSAWSPERVRRINQATGRSQSD